MLKKSKIKNYNKEIEALIDRKETNKEKYTAEDISFIKQYSGAGGQKGENRGILDEYYTPEYICSFMYELAKKYGYTKGNILEPSIATGNIIEPFYKNNDFKSITGFEINVFSKKICELLYPKVEIHNKYFETAFLQPDRFTTLAKKTWLSHYPFDLVIGNPPYGKHINKYSSFFTGKNKFPQVEIFFIYKGLELLKADGLLVYITGQNFMRNGFSYEKHKEKIAQIADFVDAYRLPKVFENTSIPTDILVFRKKA